VREKVLLLLRGPVEMDPDVDWEPDQLPLAMQLVALVDDQVSVEAPPVLTVEGLALILTVAAAGGGGSADLSLASVPPPQPATASTANKHPARRRP
jgi:hypothetical protein